MVSKEKILALVFLFLVLSYFFVEHILVNDIPRPDAEMMKQASGLAQQWFTLIEEEKYQRGIESSFSRTVNNGGLLGVEYSEFTTTLGSLEAKQTSLNPEFASYFVRKLHDAGITSASTVGIAVSGSFPALVISMFAALQTIGANAVVVSSVGSSSYGANQPEMTWMDIESILREKGGLQYQSSTVTYGAENDRGDGIMEEGIEILSAAAQRNNVKIVIPNNLQDAINKRVNLFRENKISLLINIGGNQAMLGNCVHSSVIPNDYHIVIRSCMHEDRGVIVRLNEIGIPVFHLLNIRSLAARNHISFE
jgi:poly-gamma-glutamate system protein